MRFCYTEGHLLQGVPLLVVILSGCAPSLDRTKLTLDVATFNVEDKPETKEETHQRMREEAQIVRTKGVTSLTLIGIQESRYTYDSSGSWQQDEEIECPQGLSKTGAHCFANYYGIATGAPIHTWRGNAVIAQPTFEMLGGVIRCPLETQADLPVGGLGRNMIGARLRHKLTGQIYPFFSAHLVPKSASLDRRLKQVKNLKTCVRNAWRPGDLPPIVVGDFNCGGAGDPQGWNKAIRDEIYGDFFEASKQVSIDLVFVGRPHMWPQAAGVILPDTTSSGTVVSGRVDMPERLTDHWMTWVRLKADLSISPTSIMVPQIRDQQDQNGRGCFRDAPSFTAGVGVPGIGLPF